MADSHHPNDVNIWGKRGCELPGGGRCIACCTIKAVTEVPTPPYTNCEFQSKSGCRIHTSSDLPVPCMIYHCSMDIERAGAPGITQQLGDMILHEVNRGAVSPKEARSAFERLRIDIRTFETNL